MKYLLQNKSGLFQHFFTSAFSMLVTAVFCILYFVRAENVRNEIDIYLRDDIVIRAEVTMLQSIDKREDLSLRQFMECELQERYIRVMQSIQKLDEKHRSDNVKAAIVKLNSAKWFVEEYWRGSGKLDCEMIGW